MLHTHFVAVTWRTRKTAPWCSDLLLVTRAFLQTNGLRSTSACTEVIVAIVSVPMELSSVPCSLVTSALGMVVMVVVRWVSGSGRFRESVVVMGCWAKGMTRFRGRAGALGFLRRLAMDRRVADSGCVER